MWRWPLPTVRALGGHDRFSCFLTARPARPRFSCTQVEAAAEELGNPAVAPSWTQSLPTSLQDALYASSASSASLLDHRDYYPATRVRVGDSAINALRRCLSPDNVTSDRPVIYSPTTIRSLYYRAESRNQLGMLDSKMLTALIGLFGSLSDLHPSLIYNVPLASHLLGVSTTRRAHWAFVLKIGKFKSREGMVLHDSDRFWLMRAELANFQASSPSELLSNNTYSAILRARTHYHAIRQHSRHPDVHTYYLEVLLATRDPRLLDFASRDLSFLLETHGVCRPWLQRLLYCLILQYGGFLSNQSQEAILAALWSRIRQGTHETASHVSETVPSDIFLGDCNSDVTSIARSASTTLFATKPFGERLTTIPLNLFTVFSPENALALRWSSLILFSIFNSPEKVHLDGTSWTNDHAIPQITSYWQVIFGLATVEKILRNPSPAFEGQEISETTHSLYQRWLSIIKSCSVPPDLTFTVATSFLKIANTLADANLFNASQDLYLMANDSTGSRTLVPKPFAAQYIAAAVRTQSLLPDGVLTILKDFASDPKRQNEVLSSAVEVLAPSDPTLANTLLVFVRGRGMQLDATAVHTLATSLAQRGALRQVVPLLNDSQFTLETRGILLAVIARNLRGKPQAHHPQSILIAIVDEIVALYQSHVPPEHFRGHLEQLLIILARHGRGSQLLPAVQSILTRLPGFFQPRFFGRYCHALMRYRQYSIVRKVLDAATTVHPQIARSLRVLVDRIALQTKTSRMFKCTPLRGSTSLQLSSRLRHCPDAGVPLEHSLESLLKLGRVVAAKRIFASLAATVPRTRCTALGNILIHGVALQPTPRNGRRVRKVLALLENLVQDHGFRPDRVTANILIKVMISWRSAFNSPRLRGLFDQLISAGYPAGNYSPLQPPFGIQQTQFWCPSSFSKLPDFVSFERHSRPLFKMFIKGFYTCNDVEAARKVVGILKVEEYKNAVAKEARRKARLRGKIKAAQRNPAQ